MKKVLHANQTLFLKLPDKISKWDKDSIDVLLEFVNGVHDLKEVNEKDFKGFRQASILRPIESLSYEETVAVLIRIYFNCYIDGGLTEKLIDELNSILQRVRFKHILMPSKNGHVRWEFIADFTKQLYREEFAAILFSHLLSIGALDNLQCCQLEHCNRFFVGPPNRRWCSDTCGSKHRVRKKRKRDSA